MVRGKRQVVALFEKCKVALTVVVIFLHSFELLFVDFFFLQQQMILEQVKLMLLFKPLMIFSFLHPRQSLLYSCLRNALIVQGGIFRLLT